VGEGFVELAVEAALEVLGHDGALGLVALVEERQRKASAGSRKISQFSAQVITVRGDISATDRRPRSPCA
jgi:hypothetical protein